MPSRKAATAKTDAGGGDDGGDKGFRWDADNERKLLLMMVGTTGYNKDDYDFLAKDVFPGTTANAIKQRVCKLRGEHRALYEQYGKTAPDGKSAAGKSEKGAATPKVKKRKEPNGTADADDTQVLTPKKGRKAKSAATVADNEADVPTNDLIEAEDADNLVKTEDSTDV